MGSNLSDLLKRKIRFQLLFKPLLWWRSSITHLSYSRKTDKAAATFSGEARGTNRNGFWNRQ